MNILKQEGAYSLSIDKDGKAVFTVGDVSVTSKEAVNDGTLQVSVKRMAV